MNLEQIDTSTTAGKALAQFAELLKVGGYEGELRIGREFGEALVAEIQALNPPDGFVLVPKRPTLVMIGKGGVALRGGGYAVDIYKAMIAARPEVK